jgi:hypothetical protein
MGWTFYNSSGQQLRNTGTVLATQAEMVAETVLTSFVTPGRTQYHPGVAKAWCHITPPGALTSGSYNIDSITDSGTGDRTVVFDTDFADTNYAVWSVVVGGDTTNMQVRVSANKATGSVDADVYDTEADGVSDQQHFFGAFGVQ